MRAVPRHQPARRLRLVIVLTALALAACAQPLTVHTVSNPEASFDHYRTFSFGAAEGLPRGYATSPWSPETRRRIQPLIVAALTQRGYALASGKGDLVIRFGSGRRVVAVQEATPPEGEQSEVESPHFDYDEVDRAMVIEAFDASSGVRVWHGSSRAEIDPDRVNQALVQRSVSALLAGFPSAAPGTPAAPIEAPSASAPATSRPASAERVDLTSATLPLGDPAPPAAAVDVALDDGQIARVASEIDLAEIGAAKLALSRTKSTRMRVFAQHVLGADTADEEKLGAIGRAENLRLAGSRLSTKLPRDGRAEEQALMGQFDSDFDREYIAEQIQVHQDVLDLIDRQLLPNVRSVGLRSALQSTRTMVVRQIEMAEEVRRTELPTPTMEELESRGLEKRR